MNAEKARAVVDRSAGGLLFLVLLLCFLSEIVILPAGSWPGNLLLGATAELRDAQTQWMVFLGLAFYFFLFTVFRIRDDKSSSGSDPVWGVLAVAFIAAFAYAAGYPTSARPPEALILLAGVTLGMAVAVWRFRLRKSDGTRVTRMSVFLVVTLLLAASLCVWINRNSRFEYRGQMRWTGPWDNPNTFGILMGTGIALAAGCTVSNLKLQTSGWRARSWRWFKIVGLAAAAGMMAVGLMKSYSRGAWLAAICGAFYLAVPTPRFKFAASGWLRKRILSLSVITVSASFLLFLEFRNTENVPARRALSVGNRNDFSWRNRVAAWEGALQIIAARPWLGCGWNQTKPAYENYYLAERVPEAGAIEMNDYLKLASTLGIPALGCFVAYFWLSLLKQPERRPVVKADRGQGRVEEDDLDWLKVTCRAGAIVLLVGFWFDGGLFKLTTASTFWILLELGKRTENG